jgi:hypothetical protein
MTERRLNDEDTSIIYFNFRNSADFRFIIVAGTGVGDSPVARITGAGNITAKNKY